MSFAHIHRQRGGGPASLAHFRAASAPLQLRTTMLRGGYLKRSCSNATLNLRPQGILSWLVCKRQLREPEYMRWDANYSRHTAMVHWVLQKRFWRRISKVQLKDPPLGRYNIVKNNLRHCTSKKT
jgi:hypothetical protein